MCSEFTRAMLLMSPKYLRQSTRRSNISYNVFVGEDISSVDSSLTQLDGAAPPTSSTVIIHNWMNSTDCRKALQGRFMDGVDAVSCGQVDPDKLTCGVCNSLFTEDLQPTGLEQTSQAPQPPIPAETPSLLEPRLMPIRDSILTQMTKKEYERHDKFRHDILPKSPRGMHIVHAL